MSLGKGAAMMLLQSWEEGESAVRFGWSGERVTLICYGGQISCCDAGIQNAEVERWFHSGTFSEPLR